MRNRARGMGGGDAGGRHDRCGARTRAAGVCGLPAGWGTEHVGTGPCRVHGGNLPSHVKRARRLAAAAAVSRLGIPVATTPEEALQSELARANGAVEWLSAKVSGLSDEAIA